MSSLYNPEMPHDNGRSKAFLLGLYLGLSLLLLVSHLDPNHDSPLHKATNIYAVQALAGAILGFWRIRKRAENPRKTPALASVWICFGLAIWVIGQGLWTGGSIKFGEDQYPWWSDIFYIASDLCWLVALFYIFKSLDRRRLIENGPFITIATTALGLLVSGFVYVDRILIIAKKGFLSLPILTCDLTYILITFLSMILAVALVFGEENAEIPFPVHQCIRYLCAATAIDACAILAFTVTDKIAENEPFGYFNGNWVDWLFLTAMYCWGVSVLKCPIRREELQYTSGTRRSGLQEDDIYRASEIAESYSQATHGIEARAIYSDSIRWILDTIPRCWRVVKLGDLVVGSTFVFPVPQLLIDAFLDGEMNETKEREMFEEVKKKSPTWECLYLADASIVAKHRRRGLAFKCFRETIENIAEEHNSKIKVYCWPNTLERKGLADKLRRHFETQGISVIKVE